MIFLKSIWKLPLDISHKMKHCIRSIWRCSAFLYLYLVFMPKYLSIFVKFCIFLLFAPFPLCYNKITILF